MICSDRIKLGYNRLLTFLTPPQTTIQILNPTPEQSIGQSDQIKLEAKIGTAAPPKIEFTRQLTADFKAISASEMLFPPYEIEITPGFCVNNLLSSFAGKGEYCVEPIKISVNWAEKLRDALKIEGYNSGPQTIGSLKLPGLEKIPFARPRIVWENATDSQTLALENIDKDRPPSVSLPPGAIKVGRKELKAKAYGPFVLKNGDKPELLGESSVTINVKP